MTVSELKELYRVDGVSELRTDAHYLITVPVECSMTQIHALTSYLTAQGLHVVIVTDDVKFYKIEGDPKCA